MASAATSFGDDPKELLRVVNLADDVEARAAQILSGATLFLAAHVLRQELLSNR
jgi:hypothetical protein